MKSAAIELGGVRFGWGRGPDVLEIEVLTIARGARVFLQGASGSGKSTLLGLIGGVLSPRAGRIEVLGQALDRLTPAARDRFRAEHVGVVFQLFNLLPYLDLVDNVLLPLRFAPLRRARVAAAGSLRSAAERLLDALGLDATIRRRRDVTELSVGQQQRVAVARALIGAPEVVLCDEPTSALDHDTRAAFLHLLLDHVTASGSTLVFVSHDPSLRDHFPQQIDFATLNRAAAVRP